MSIEERIRRSLTDRAAQAHPSDDAWSRIAIRTGSARRHRNRAVYAMAGAVPLFVVAVLAVGAMRDDDPGDQAVVAGPAARPAAGAASGIDYSRPDAPRRLGTGLVEAVSVDGSALLVADHGGRSETPGCQGLPAPSLQRVPLDGGERTAVRSAEGNRPVRGRVLRGPGGKVAVVYECRAFTTEVLVGTETADGRLEDLTRLADGLAPETRLQAWSASGGQLLAISTATPPGSSPEPVAVRIDPAGGAVTQLFQGGMQQVGELADGSLVVATDDNRVRIRRPSGEWSADAPGRSFAIAPDGRRVAAYGDDITLMTAAGVDTAVGIPAGEQVTDVEWAGPGDALAYTSERLTADGTRLAESYVALHHPGGQPARIAITTTGLYAGLAFAPAGDRLAFSHIGDEPGYRTEAFTIRFPTR